MRKLAQGSLLKCRAVAGTHVVTLAWDFLDSEAAKRDAVIGFAIERSELKNGTVVERYWMRSIKRFKDKDKGLPPGTPVPTNEHPIQSFQWGDYTAESERTYKYRIVPTFGEPKNLQLDEANAVEVQISTEPQTGANPLNGIRHDIFFNRGVIGSQAYARRFENAEPDPDNPSSEEMVWLSRGLFEAMMGFIGRAKNEDFGLRAAVYEFHYQPVANAFAKAIEAGADVKIIYDAESSYKTGNLKTIQAAGLDQYDSVIPRTVSEGIRHNKFILLLHKNKPIAIWTGSTNISAGGIFGHSNVGHIVWDTDVAKDYLSYWDRLAKNPTPTKLRPLNRVASPTPAGKPDSNSIISLFSARDEKGTNDTLQWYADRMAEATRIVCFTVAFNLDGAFQKVISQDSDVLRYIVKDDDLGDGEIIGRDRDVLFAAGAYFGYGALANFLKERDNPLNTNNYIHDKFMLVDPLGNDPLVVTGTANFSKPSQTINDENMLVIRGDTRVADIYFGEFMRVFDHHYARYLVRKLTAENKHDPNAGYLKTEPKDWVPSHFAVGNYKEKRRRYFLEA